MSAAGREGVASPISAVIKRLCGGDAEGGGVITSAGCIGAESNWL